MSKWIGILVAVVVLISCGWVLVKSLRRKPFTSIRGGGGGGGDEQPPQNN
ncbi:MAG TPA: hypothetical protein VNA25_08185 [Phycisphaerae bacterium]|nr:hypothetical protein [Phycisphaerae bacterium]